MGCAECTYVALYSLASTTFNSYLGHYTNRGYHHKNIVSLITAITKIITNKNRLITVITKRKNVFITKITITYSNNLSQSSDSRVFWAL